jgi:membrane-associated phospholipid phosphatase
MPAFANLSQTSKEKQSSQSSFFMKTTVIPLAVAFVSGVSGLDHSIQQFAENDHPLFGNTSVADTKSNHFRSILKWQAIFSALLLPDSSGRYSWQHFVKSASNFIIGYSLTLNLTYAIKHSTRRMRPDRSDRLSFPSGHTSSAVFYTMYIMNQISTLSMKKSLKHFIQFESILLAAGCGWARIEANKHYLSDVLASIAVAGSMQLFMKWLTGKIGHKYQLFFQFNPSFKQSFVAFQYVF